MAELPENQNDNRGADGPGPVGIVLAILMLVAVGLAGAILFANWFSGMPDRQRSSDTGVLVEPRASGDRVVLLGRIEMVNSPHSFVLDIGETVAGRRVLVLSREPVFSADGGPINVRNDANTLFQITGRARRFHREDIERELGIDLDDETFKRFEDNVVVVAEKIERIKRHTPLI